MTQTAERNGVLIYLAPETQRFAVLGDSGIHGASEPGFWSAVAATMQPLFREGRFTDGVVGGGARGGGAARAALPAARGRRRPQRAARRGEPRLRGDEREAPTRPADAAPRRPRAHPPPRVLGLQAVPARLRGGGVRRPPPRPPPEAAHARSSAAGPTLAASVLVLLTTVLLLVPVLTSLFLLVQQAATFLDWLRTQPLVGPETLERFWDELPQRYPGLGPWMSWVRSQVAPAVEGGLGQVAAGASDLLQGVIGTLTHAVARPRPLPAHAVLPPARRRPAQVRAAAGLALLRAAGAADLRPPRAHDPGCAAGRDRRARRPGDPRRPRLHALRRPLAVRVGHGGDPRRDGADRRLAARLAARGRVPLPARRDGHRRSASSPTAS